MKKNKIEQKHIRVKKNKAQTSIEKTHIKTENNKTQTNVNSSAKIFEKNLGGQAQTNAKINKAQTNIDYTQTNAEKSPRKSALSLPRSDAECLLRGPRESAYIEWQAPEFEYREKDVSWYWLSLIISIILVALSFWQKNFLFAVFVIIAWLVIVYSANRLPAVWNFKIDDKGIEISLANTKEGQKFYPYTDLEGFDIHPNSDRYKELILKRKSRLSPYIKINIFIEDEEKIKNFLMNYIPKEEYGVSLSDSISKLLRF